MFGGTEIVESAIECAMAEQMKSQEVPKKVQEELAQVVGFDRKVHEFDLEKFMYLKCVVKETLRLHPSIPLRLHKIATSTVINNYNIPAKARVMINVWVIGHDPDTWNKPDTFKLSRFLDNNAPDFKGSNFEYLPFGSNRRSCLVVQLGLYSLKLTVAHLCHNFNWELPNGLEPNDLDMNDVFGLTAPRQVQLMAIPIHRLNFSLF